jgi:predicted Zn-dependent peptidase
MLPLLLALAAPPAHAIDIPHETYKLDNGLEVVLVPDRRLPKVVVDVWYDVGSYDDPPGKSGFAHLFEHLMFKGTGRVAEGEFDTLMEQAGGWNNASTADERTNYFDVAPSSALELLLWLEADRMTALDITQAKLDVEREVVRNEKRQNYEDRPYGELWMQLPGALYPTSNPLHRPGIGSHEELMASTVDDVTAFYRTWYVPSNAVLCVAGDFDAARIKPLIQRLFGGLEIKPRPTRQLAPMPDKPVKPTVTVKDDVTLPMLVLAWHGPAAYAEGDAALDVLSHLLTGSQDARLTKRLVHEERLAQTVDASQWSGRWQSQFVVDLMVAPSVDLDGVRSIVDEELAALVNDRPPTREEVDRAIATLEMSQLGNIETLLGRAEQLQRYRMYAGRYDYVAEDLARYRAVTPEAVAAVARKLAPGARTEIRVLPEEK